MLRLSRQHNLRKIAFITLISLLMISCGESTSNHLSTNTIDYSKDYPPNDGGTLIDAMTGEPSGLIAMIAGESAASAIAVFALGMTLTCPLIGDV